MQPVQIAVTEEDIAQGELKSQWRCPVALAVVRQLPGKYVALESILPADREQVAQFVQRFDNKQAVQPFTFESTYFDTPPSWWDMGEYRK